MGVGVLGELSDRAGDHGRRACCDEGGEYGGEGAEDRLGGDGGAVWGLGCGGGGGGGGGAGG